MDKKINVVLYGVGHIGAKIAEMLYERPCYNICGAIDIAPDKIGRDLTEIAGITNKRSVIIEDDITKVLQNHNIDVVILTTTSFMEKITLQIKEILSFGINILSTCEELSYPWITFPAIAKEIDAIAKEKRVSVLSTGINPGFLMDFLPMVMTGICRNIKHISIERIQNAANRRTSFQQKVGIGLTLKEFERKVQEGRLRHIGLTESMHMLSDRIGWQLEKTEDVIEPIIARNRININDVSIEKGMTLGVKQIGKGFSQGKEMLSLLFIASADIDQAYDRINIKGIPDIDTTIKDGVNGDIGACAMITNAIPTLLKAAPGLRTMADVEPISFRR